MNTRELEAEKVVRELQGIYLQLYGLRIFYNLPHGIDHVIEESYNNIEKSIKEMMPPERLTEEILYKLKAMGREFKYLVKPTPYSVIFSKEKPVMKHYIWEGDIEISEEWVREIPVIMDRVLDIEDLINYKIKNGHLIER